MNGSRVLTRSPHASGDSCTRGQEHGELIIASNQSCLMFQSVGVNPHPLIRNPFTTPRVAVRNMSCRLNSLTWVIWGVTCGTTTEVIKGILGV